MPKTSLTKRVNRLEKVSGLKILSVALKFFVQARTVTGTSFETGSTLKKVKFNLPTGLL